MDPWIIIYLKFYGLFLLSAIMLFGFGHVLMHLISHLIVVKGFYQKIFFSLSIGIFSVIIISSLVKTHFITISTGFFLIGIFLIYELYKARIEGNKIFSLKAAPENYSKKEVLLNIFWLIFLSLFFFSWQAIVILKAGSFPFIVSHRDYIYYADISETMWKTGQENAYMAGNLINKEYWGTTPYHYFEFWLDNFFSWVFRIENLLSSQLLVIPLFLFMMAVGLFSIAESFRKVKLKESIIIFSLLLIGGIPFNGDAFPLGPSQWITNIESPLIYVKASHHYWIAIIGFLFIVNQFFTLGFIVFLSMLFVSGTTFPAISCGGFVFLILSFFFRLQTRTEFLKQSAYLTLCIIFFIFFYLIFGNDNFSFRTYYPFLHYTDLDPVLKIGFNFFTVKVFLVELGVRIYHIPIEIFFMMIPFILLTFFLMRKTSEFSKLVRNSFILISSIFFSGIIISGIFYKMWDSWQFFENICFFILSFFAVAFILFLNLPVSSSLKKKSIIFIVLFSILKLSSFAVNRKINRDISIQNYSDEYLLEISNTIYSANPLGIFFRSLCATNKIEDPVVPITNRIGGYTSFFPQYSTMADMSLISMAHCDTGNLSELEQAIVKTSPFYLFVEKQKMLGKFKSFDKSQIDFIDEFSIGYAVVGKNTFISPLIEERTKKVIVDQASGEKFLFLDGRNKIHK